MSEQTRVALVTGGTRGIGLATARTLRDAGMSVAVTHRSAPCDLDGVLSVPCDVTDSGQVDDAFSRVETELGPVTVVVSNAGITRDGLFVRMGEGDFTDVVDANLTGSYRVAQRATKGLMKARWGRLIFVSSVVGQVGQAGQANYAASKAGLVGLSRSLARELGSRNVTSNVVAPGPIATDMTDALTDAQRAAISDAVPLGRFGEVDDVAAAIAYLASDAASYITGAVIPVDGGLGMGG